MKRVSRMPTYPYVVTPFPVVNLTREELRGRAREMAADVLRLLKERPGAALADPHAGAARAASSASREEFASRAAALEAFHDRGWTDGLPVEIPTPELVAEFLEAAHLAPQDLLGSIATRENIDITAEKLAINAVMAGAKPQYMPLIATAMRALCAPEHNLHAHTATLMGAAQVVIVNGPVRARLGINSHNAALGPGWRANSSIGRALRLTIRNVMRSVPGEFDRAGFSQPGRYGWCFGEDEEEAPWPTLAMDDGLPAGRDAVTVYSTTWQMPIMIDSRDPQELIRFIGYGARQGALYGRRRGAYSSTVFDEEGFFPQRKFLFIIGSEHRRVLQAAGIGKDELQRELFRCLTEPPAENAQLPPAAIASPENVMIASLRGTALYVSWFFFPFYSSKPVTLALPDA
jgi:hypothetical protein